MSLARPKNQPQQKHGIEPIFLLCKAPLQGKQETMSEQDNLMERVEALKSEHRDLDDAILALSQRGVPDMVQIQRLKKRKLFLKDEILKIESQLLPDIIA
jgi:hypothetical protein